MRSLTPKLILAFLIVSLTGIVVASFVANRMISNAFGNFSFDQDQGKVKDELINYYTFNGHSWLGVDKDESLRFLAKGGPPPKPQDRKHSEGGSSGRNGSSRGYENRTRQRDQGPPFGPPSFPRRGPYFVVADQNGQVVFAGIGFTLGHSVPPFMLANGEPLEVEGEVVGTFITRRDDFLVSAAEVRFLERVRQLFMIGGVAASAVALVLGALLASTLTRPLRELIVATGAVAKGELEQEVPVRSQDELGELAASFNQMSSDLTHSRNLRRQMTADIAHELRTPLSIILGHAEALHDEVLPPTPDTFYIILDEAQRLQRLIEDLRTLSLAEAGELPLMRGPISPQTLLEKAAAGYAPHAEQKEIDLQVHIAPNLPSLYLDSDRMAQVFGNLLGNALRYTPTKGQISLSATNGSNQVEIRVHNSGRGIPPEDLPYIFERFYRGDKSRKRHDGGSGLGLAIAKSIVEGHDGRIWAESEVAKGVTFVIQLPVF